MSMPIPSSRVRAFVNALYVAATVGIVAWVVLTVARASFQLTSSVLVIAGALFVLGFAITAVPMLRKVWSYSAGKLAFTIVNVIVLLVANSLARTVLSSATGLPGQDFDWAVAMLSVLLYVPAVVATLSVFLGTLAVLGQVWVYARLMLTSGGNREVWREICHVAGAFAALFFILNATQLYEKHRHLLNPLARGLTYAGDYQRVSSYPGIAPGTYVVFHENGVVSILNQKGEPRVIVKKLDQND